MLCTLVHQRVCVCECMCVCVLVCVEVCGWVGLSLALLSLTPLRLVAGAMDDGDANLNFALVAALFCASSGRRNAIISQSRSHIGVPYMEEEDTMDRALRDSCSKMLYFDRLAADVPEDTMDRAGAGRNANALSSANSTVVSGRRINSIEREPGARRPHTCVGGHVCRCGWLCVESIHIYIYI